MPVRCRPSRKGKFKDENRAYYLANAERIKAERRARYAQDPEKFKSRRQRRLELSKLYEYRSGAKRRGIKFALTEEEFFSFWGANCSYCGDLIETIGLDRIDNRKGYVLGNVRACCRACNIAKAAMSSWEFIDHFRKVVMRADWDPKKWGNRHGEILDVDA